MRKKLIILALMAVLPITVDARVGPDKEVHCQIGLYGCQKCAVIEK